MKAIERIEEGYLLNFKNANMLKGDLLSNIRTSLRCLARIGTLKYKEIREIEFFMDKIVYRINEIESKGGKK